ncbi:RHS repeat protein [Myroides pelagicus]|uniref:RHS repeat-associated core domain-containing protein n=1 Tax=Myroides pelagicus TaxID=270914 RepID=A0A7K1GSZ7_9FLAO|nr:RHS repeat protein [Myroides pelagicus]MTH31073.1 hypothetical protein [Myroides pelagicus]
MDKDNSDFSNYYYQNKLVLKSNNQSFNTEMNDMIPQLLQYNDIGAFLNFIYFPLMSSNSEGSVNAYFYNRNNLIRSIDTNLINTSYKYDEANRLKQIVDDKGNILQEYEYNYKNN